MKPITKAQLHRDVAERIEHEGLNYTLRDYFPPEYADDLDPELAKLWRQYIDVARTIEAHVGVV